jgi:hypothetical protein
MMRGRMGWPNAKKHVRKVALEFIIGLVDAEPAMIRIADGRMAAIMREDLEGIGASR